MKHRVLRMASFKQAVAVLSTPLRGFLVSDRVRVVQADTDL